MQVDVKEVKLEIYVPEEYIGKIRDALAERGIGRVGNYSHVAAYQESKGFWKPLEGSKPYHGEIGELCSGSEMKMEVRCPVEKVKQAFRIIQTVHPYEEPVINIVPLLNGQLF